MCKILPLEPNSLEGMLWPSYPDVHLVEPAPSVYLKLRFPRSFDIYGWYPQLTKTTGSPVTPWVASIFSQRDRKSVV